MKKDYIEDMISYYQAQNKELMARHLELLDAMEQPNVNEYEMNLFVEEENEILDRRLANRAELKKLNEKLEALDSEDANVASFITEYFKLLEKHSVVITAEKKTGKLLIESLVSGDTYDLYEEE